MGASRAFNGTTDVIIAANSLATLPQYTVMLQIAPSFADTNTSTYELFVRQGTVGDQPRSCRIIWEGSFNRWVSDSKGAFAFTASDANTPFSADDWHSIAFGYAGASLSGQFWWDGNPVTTVQLVHNTGANNTASMPFNIGAQISTFFFPGKIAHAQVWNRKLSNAEIKQAHECPGSVLNGLVAYWPLFGSDTPELDLSGNGNTGAVTGATESTDGPPIFIPSSPRTSFFYDDPTPPTGFKPAWARGSNILLGAGAA
jgi:hypothetical protein